MTNQPHPFTLRDVRPWLTEPGAASNKVSRGIAGFRTGCPKYPGAAVLGVTAAWRTGVGMVRFVPPADDASAHLRLPAPEAAVLAARPETVFGDGDASAWVVGSGTDPVTRSFSETAAIEQLLQATAPVVLDAGALGCAVHAPSSAPRVLTPHWGEFTRLWKAVRLPESELLSAEDPAQVTARAAVCGQLAEKLGATILLKGSTSVVATPGGEALAAGPATPLLATAGTGDVLAGILGALVAGFSAGHTEVQDRDLLHLAASAAVLHDRAARIATRIDKVAHTGGHTPAAKPITAMDVAEVLPQAVSEALGTAPRTVEA